MKKLFKFAISGILSFALSPCFGIAGAKNLTLVLDPGHGGSHPGCVYTYNEKTVIERDLTLKIAKYLKEELQKYKTKKGEKVVVHLTRDDNNTAPGLEERVLIAKDKKAAALISLHINASANKDSGGCMVLVTHSNHNNLYKKEHNMGKSILKELNNTGVKTAKIYNATGENEGLLRKLSDDGSKYPNGDTTDWYGIIRHGINHNIPSVLVEHAFLSNKNDYEKFLSSDKKLKKLAVADAKGIAKYYKLKPKNNNKKKQKPKSNEAQKKTQEPDAKQQNEQKVITEDTVTAKSPDAEAPAAEPLATETPTAEVSSAEQLTTEVPTTEALNAEASAAEPLAAETTEPIA